MALDNFYCGLEEDSRGTPAQVGNEFMTQDTNRLLKNAHLLRCPYPSLLRRTSMYVSLLAISGALYLSVFEQPANRVFFSTLLVPGQDTRRRIH
jgi:hypothetical protein